MVRFEDGVYHVTGKIDSTNAEQFKAEMAEAEGKESAILDFGEVQYISSAGLRVLLALKKTGCSVEIVNVSSEVYDIFDVTGFNELLKVEKAVREVSVEGLRCIGTGATGSAYRLDSERIIKLFLERIGRDRVEAEQKTAREAFVMGVPTCIPFEVVKQGNCYGIIYELINSSTLEELFAKTDDTDELVKKYVELLKTASAIHYGENAKGMDITGVMTYVASNLKNVFFTEEEFAGVIRLFKNMKKCNNFVHGDAHPGNVMVQDNELIYIDMTTSGFGDPFWDLVALANPLSVNAVIFSEEKFEKEYDMTREKALGIYKKIFEIYYEGQSADEIERLEQLATGTAALRALLGELHNPNRDAAVIDSMKRLAMDAATLLD